MVWRVEPSWLIRRTRPAGVEYVGWDYVGGVSALLVVGMVAGPVALPFPGWFWVLGLAITTTAWVGAFFRLTITSRGVVLEKGCCGVVVSRTILPATATVEVRGLEEWGDSGEDGGEIIAELQDPNGLGVLDDLTFGSRRHANALTERVRSDLSRCSPSDPLGWDFYAVNESWTMRMAHAFASLGVLRADAQAQPERLSLRIRGAAFTRMLGSMGWILVGGVVCVAALVAAGSIEAAAWVSAMAAAAATACGLVAVMATQTIEYGPQCVRVAWSVLGVPLSHRHRCLARGYRLYASRTLRGRHPEKIWVSPLDIKSLLDEVWWLPTDAQTSWGWPYVETALRAWFQWRLDAPSARSAEHG